MLIRNPDTEAVIAIQCDHAGCKTLAPDASVTLKAGGLIKMGWRCSGGTHYCQEHA
jgi:hypothetical protein